METGKLIRELRLKKGMTQEELAEKTEVSTRTIQRIENGEVDPRAYTLQMIAKALEVDFSLFVGQEADESRETEMVQVNNWLGLLHLSGVLPLIFPTLLIWSLKKNKIKGISWHYRQVIRFQLMILGILTGCLWIYWKTNQLTPLFGVLLVNLLFCLFNAIQVTGGKPYWQGPFFNPGNKNEDS